MKITKGTLYGVGVGPGDPELLTLKAARLIDQADVISYLTNAYDQTILVDGVHKTGHKAGHSQARTIAAQFIEQRALHAQELPIAMGYLQNRTDANETYDYAAHKIAQLLDQGQDVVFLCEGDPLFFGSYAYLQERLCQHHTCIAVPGISSPNAASAAAGIPLAMQTENYAVLSGRLSQSELTQQLTHFDNLVIMKAGRTRPQIIEALKETDRFNDAVYVAYATRKNETITYDLSELDNEAGPYFSLFIVSRKRNLRTWKSDK